MFRIAPNLIARKHIKKGDVVVRVYKNYCRPAEAGDGKFLYGVCESNCRKGQRCRIIPAGNIIFVGSNSFKNLNLN